ncbi:sialate O-acetylesterase [Desertivirga xinjiangensis]|uniref:sialate O-acetylesterase n=1 Tax=Desertivirga xinjiangensis TaxID=539206 RepID=UPI002108DFBE|nr:sialate O-acetylesterase [Pedobacter xinjiangensis]
MNKRGLSFLCSLMAISGSLFAKVSLPSVFSGGMVLQQQAEVKLWGTSDSKGSVAITTSWNNKSYTVKPAEDGSWAIRIKTPNAGGPYSISLNDGEMLSLGDVLIGEVWLASGQSNMEMPLKGFKDQPVAGAEKAVKESENSQIRFFNVPNVSWKKPLYDCKGAWLKANPANTRNFSAVAYFYAKELQEKLKVPVGIIEADWGGTLVQAWMSKQALSAFPNQIPQEQDAANENKNMHTGLYNGMISPIAGYGIRGAIWYQGEQNRHEPQLYAQLFPAMVKQWRSDWGIGDFPFYYAQIAPYIFKREELTPALLELQPKVPFLREAQLKAENEIPNSGMAVLTDIGIQSTIHPPEKEAVAKRLSYQALAKTYKFKNIPFSGPVYKRSEIKGNALTLLFDHSDNGLVLKNKRSMNFELAGNDKVFYPAKVSVEKDRIVLSSDKVSNPVAARYAFKAWVAGDLFNKDGLPASSFRTDNWEIN